MPTPTIKKFYAGSMNRSGVYVFDTEAERDEWISANNGFVLEASQVAPELR